MGQLEVLSLSGAVDRTDWIQVGLRDLNLRRTAVRALSRLPDDLRGLDLCNSPVEELGALPSGLRGLDLRYTYIREVGSLPTDLRFLGIGGRHLKKVSGLPDSLEMLELVEAPNLEAPLTLGSDLRTLGLVGVEPGALDSWPPRLESLVLVATSAAELDSLPASLKRLVLRDPGFRWLNLPDDLRELWMDEQQWSTIKPLPDTLLSLRLQRTAIGRAQLWPVSLRKLTLDWVTMQWGNLPPLLSDLAVRGSPLPPEFPENLISLEIGDSPALTDEALTALLNRVAGTTVSLESLSLDRIPRGLDLSDFPALRRLELKLLSPGGLPDIVLPNGLENLVVHGPVDYLPKLPYTLRELDVADCLDLRLDDLTELKDRRELETLILRNSGVEALPKLPGSLRELDISGTPIDEIRRLPRSLERLTLHVGQVARLGEVAENLKELHFVPADGQPPCPGLTSELFLP
jgi:hypothetical protein